jgi:hypothetical protein
LKPFKPNRSINSCYVAYTANIDDIIDYTVNTHDISDNTKACDSTDSLLDHMAGRILSLVYIHHGIDAKPKLDMGKNQKVNSSDSEPGTLKLGNTTCILNRGETITFNGQQYSTHVTMIHYSVGQHDVASVEKALAKGGICGDYMRVFEDSERFVDVSGLTRHKAIQLSILQPAYAFLSAHKGDTIAMFHQMTLLGEGKGFLFLSKWKSLVLASMINLICYLVESKVYLWMITNFHFSARMSFLISIVKYQRTMSYLCYFISI